MPSQEEEIGRKMQRLGERNPAGRIGCCSGCAWSCPSGRGFPGAARRRSSRCSRIGRSPKRCGSRRRPGAWFAGLARPGCSAVLGRVHVGTMEEALEGAKSVMAVAHDQASIRAPSSAAPLARRKTPRRRAPRWWPRQTPRCSTPRRSVGTSARPTGLAAPWSSTSSQRIPWPV